MINQLTVLSSVSTKKRNINEILKDIKGLISFCDINEWSFNSNYISILQNITETKILTFGYTRLMFNKYYNSKYNHLNIASIVLKYLLVKEFNQNKNINTIFNFKRVENKKIIQQHNSKSKTGFKYDGSNGYSILFCNNPIKFENNNNISNQLITIKNNKCKLSKSKDEYNGCNAGYYDMYILLIGIRRDVHSMKRYLRDLYCIKDIVKKFPLTYNDYKFYGLQTCLSNRKMFKDNQFNGIYLVSNDYNINQLRFIPCLGFHSVSESEKLMCNDKQKEFNHTIEIECKKIDNSDEYSYQLSFWKHINNISNISIDNNNNKPMKQLMGESVRFFPEIKTKKFDKGIFNLQAKYQYHLAVVSKGCDCHENSVVIGHGCLK